MSKNSYFESEKNFNEQKNGESKNKYKYVTYHNRQDEAYKKYIAGLLSIKNLEFAAVDIQGDKRDVAKTKMVKIKFCGLSALTLLAGGEFNNNDRNEATEAFIKLISNHDGIIEKLNSKGIGVEIKFLFPYPYSDFFYDIVFSEQMRQPGFSIECIKKGLNYKSDFTIANTLGYGDLTNSKTYNYLRGSLGNIEKHLSEKFTKAKESKNKFVIKFTPIPTLCCMLKINNTIFVDPYFYAKNSPADTIFALKSPIVQLINPLAGNDKALLEEGCLNVYNHFCGCISHFRYLWEHPLTLYCQDATKYELNNDHNSLTEFIRPANISYKNKAQRLYLKNREEVNLADVDLWKQHAKYQLLKYCSKFSAIEVAEIDKDSKRKIKLKPVTIFIAGAWNDNRTRDYMRLLQGFFEEKFSKQNAGLRIDVKIVEVEPSRDIQRSVYSGLSYSKLGMVIHTPDITDNVTGLKYSKPNVYLEKGYLKSQFGKCLDRKKEETDAVFVWKCTQVQGESNENNLACTEFIDIDDFGLQLFRVAKWLWDITELNNEYIIEVLTTCKNEIINKRDSILGIIEHSNDNPSNEYINKLKNQINIIDNDYLRKIDIYIKEIKETH